jgi:hypothetical protein
MSGKQATERMYYNQGTADTIDQVNDTGTVIDVTKTRHVGGYIFKPAGVTALTIKFRASHDADSTVTGALSASNLWAYVAVVNQNDSIVLDGDTGIVITGGTDQVVNFELSLNLANKIVAEATTFTGTGDCKVMINHVDNA